MGVFGVDLSNVNNGLALNKVTPVPAFLIAKASEGTDFTDRMFPAYETQAGEMNLGHFGAYHFFHAEKLTARSEADHFMMSCNPHSGMSLWLDYESYGTSPQQDAEEVGYFIDEIKVHFPPAKVGIYCNSTGLGRLLPYLNEIPFNGLWYANPSIPIDTQSPGLGWQIHQYATTNTIDRDYWNWDIAKIKQYYTWA